MTFKRAYEAMKQGDKVKLPEWGGYWKWENDTIMMYCKDGKVLDIRETDDVDFTFSNIIRDDWEIVKESFNFGEMMDFGEALLQLRIGKKVAREGWNGKNQYIELASYISYKNSNGADINVNHNDIGNKAIAFVGTSGVQMGWLASQADMLADDWQVVE